MIVKTSIALCAAGAIGLAAAGLSHAQAEQTRNIVVAQQVKQKDHKNHRAQNTGNNKSQPHKFKQPNQNTFSSQNKTHKPKVTIKNNKKTFTGNKTKTPHNVTIKKPNAVVHVRHPKGTHSKTVTTQKLRGLSATGVGHATIKGHRYSTWRHGRYRRRYHNAWITFVPLSVLAAILIDERQYYPYAYIDAPDEFCYGRTEDGCQLEWDDVETEEGELVGQCVAYCPWRD
jgi:hypothetical protein